MKYIQKIKLNIRQTTQLRAYKPTYFFVVLLPLPRLLLPRALALPLLLTLGSTGFSSGSSSGLSSFFYYCAALWTSPPCIAYISIIPMLMKLSLARSNFAARRLSDFSVNLPNSPIACFSEYFSSPSLDLFLVVAFYKGEVSSGSSSTLQALFPLSVIVQKKLDMLNNRYLYKCLYTRIMRNNKSTSCSKTLIKHDVNITNSIVHTLNYWNK